MKRNDFLCLLDELLELDAGTLAVDQTLDSIDRWDSLAVMGFIALMDERFELVLSPKRLAECKTVGDLAGLAGDRITG